MGETFEQLRARIDASGIPNPQQRAEIIWTQIGPHLSEFSQWDMICFSISYLAQLAQVAEFDYMKSEIATLGKKLYMAHYVGNAHDEPIPAVRSELSNNATERDDSGQQQSNSPKSLFESKRDRYVDKSDGK